MIDILISSHNNAKKDCISYNLLHRLQENLDSQDSAKIINRKDKLKEKFMSNQITNSETEQLLDSIAPLEKLHTTDMPIIALDWPKEQQEPELIYTPSINLKFLLESHNSSKQKTKI